MSENDNDLPKHDTRKELAKDLGWSTDKVAEAEVKNQNKNSFYIQTIVIRI